MSRRRFALLASVLALVAVLGAVVAGLALRSSGGETLAEGGVPQDRPGPVILVPGYGGGTSGLQSLAARLRASGREAQILQAVGNGTGNLRAQANALDKAVDRALERGAPSVDLVGYSAGGVVVRLWVAEHDGEHKARRIVTLGSPHHGTEVATTASALAPESCPEACRQLRQDSELLASLNARDETPDGPRWVSLWTDADSVVTPADSARLEGAVNIALQDVCSATQVSHGSLPTDPLPVGLVLQALGPGLDGPPPAQQCGDLRALGQGTHSAA